MKKFSILLVFCAFLSPVFSLSLYAACPNAEQVKAALNESPTSRFIHIANITWTISKKKMPGYAADYQVGEPSRKIRMNHELCTYELSSQADLSSAQRGGSLIIHRELR